MALGSPTTQVFDRRTRAVTLQQTVDAAAQVTSSIRAIGGVACQIGGAATAINGFVERSIVPPTNEDTGVGGVWAPVGAALSGAPNANSILPVNYPFTGHAWYRFRVVSITGIANIAISVGSE